MKIKTLTLGPMDNNVYIVAGDKGKCILIDPAWEVDVLEKEMYSLKLKADSVFLTHGHFDHVENISELLERSNLRLYIEKNDARMLTQVHSKYIRTFHGDTSLILSDLPTKCSSLICSSRSSKSSLK